MNSTARTFMPPPRSAVAIAHKSHNAPVATVVRQYPHLRASPAAGADEPLPLALTNHKFELASFYAVRAMSFWHAWVPPRLAVGRLHSTTTESNQAREPFPKTPCNTVQKGSSHPSDRRASRPTSVINHIRSFLLERSIRFHTGGSSASAHGGLAGRQEREADGTPTPNT